ncbi:hypothetical protein TVAG_014420 [Trichomonas vaginalis G3]|uniref:Uncharacterized protein n=1 Tax=Trichomonas vaginalis (strain ATCC PRA-98 / G3) TaxID=412133 RepID=A2G561_TRIV3|nr:hypothetical protein TVAGG3_0474410 [Trichomonas vaginalis G3]EAX87703.1 hypothetical protein TVAG_014420 [Trichomonas vaginalis G3]KAI5515299.1 hypothetical protein TVAGG3_0474410 [Trichomonas vaginalis G3]|eukprot:XP_001300633.1 hypothetical protein [Trichomonas vaginalis G3]
MFMEWREPGDDPVEDTPPANPASQPAQQLAEPPKESVKNIIKDALTKNEEEKSNGEWPMPEEYAASQKKEQEEKNEINEHQQVENNDANQDNNAQEDPNNQTTAVNIHTNEENNEVEVEKTSEVIESKVKPIILDDNEKPVEIQDEQTATNESGRENTQPQGNEPHKTTKKNNKKGNTGVVDKNTFISMLRQSQTSRPRTSFRKTTRSKSTPIASDKLPLIADNILRGKDANINEPSQIAELIDELIGRRIKALDENDYLQCNKIDDAIAKLRLKYRSDDRTELFNLIKDNLDKRRKEAEAALNDKKEKWKQKWKEFDESQENEKNALHERQVKEFEDFESYWSDPNNYTEYTKRSKGQLNEIMVERQLAMTGRFVEAEQQKKMNMQNDKRMVQEQFSKLQKHYEDMRAELIQNQEKDVQKLLSQQDIKRKLLVEKENFKIGRKKKALENVNRTIEAEKKFANFCARTYKRDPSIVLPPTVIANPTSVDLPPMPPSKIHPRGVEDKVRISSKPQFVPLALPQLKIKKYSVPKIQDKKNMAGTI